MPDKILSKDQIKQLDGNIRKMISDGLGRSDIEAYARDFREKFAKSSEAPPPALRPDRSMRPTFPTFQQSLAEKPVAATPEQQVNKYDKAVLDDRNKIGKVAATIYNGLVGSLESLAGFGAELGSAYASIPSQQQLISQVVTPEKEKLKTIEETVSETKASRKVAKEGVKEVFGKAKSGYVTKKEEQEMQGKFDLFNGLGMDDLEGLVAMSGRMVGDIALAIPTAGSTYFMQGYSDYADEYDESVKKMGVEPNESARTFYGIAGGTVMGLMEKFAIDKMVGSGPIFKNIQKSVLANVLKNTSTMTASKALKAIPTIAEAEIRKLTTGFSKGGLQKIGFRAGVEAGTEAAQTAAMDGTKLVTNYIQGQEAFDSKEVKNNFFRNLANAGVAGAVYGPIIGYGISKTFGQNINNQVLEDISNAKTEEDFNKLYTELEDTFNRNNFTEAERSMVMENAKRYANIKQTIPESISPESTKSIIDLIDRREGIDKTIQEQQNSLQNTDEAVRPDIELQIATLTNARDMINDEIREQSTGEKYNYYEESGKFYKKIGEADPVEISKSRFELQNAKNYATTESERQVQEGGAEGNISQREGTQERVTQKAPIETNLGDSNLDGEEISVKSLIGRRVTFQGVTGTLFQEGQTLSIETPTQIREIGNVDEMSKVTPESMGIETEESIVEPTDTGFMVGQDELFNANENPQQAISRDQNGKVMNVVLTTKGGKRRKFRGAVAEDLAYQITLKQISNEPEFTTFLEQNADEVNAGQVQEPAQEAAARPNEQVPAGQAESAAQPTNPSTTVPTYGRITRQSDDSRPVKGRLAKKLIADAKRVLNSIQNFGDFSVNIHDQNSFEQAVLEAGGSKEDSVSRGFYIASNGEIHINIDNAAPDTVLHEGFHPILDFMARRNPKVVNDLFNELSAIPEAAGIIEMVNEQYDGEMTQKKEAITNFVAGVANGDIVLNPSNFAKIRRFIANLLKKLGLPIEPKVLLEVNNPTKLVELSKFISEMFETGTQIFQFEIGAAAVARNITFDGLEIIVGDETQDPVTVSNIAVVDPIQFEKIPVKDKVFKKVDIKWAAKGLKLITPKEKSRLYDVLSNSGGALVVINSDATGVGKKGGVLRQGGIGYTFIEQNVQDNIGFAASTDSKQTAFFKAVQEAARIRDEKSPNMKGKPVAVFVMVQTPEVMFGNAYGADYFINAVSNALSHNEIKLDDAKSDIIDYFNSIKSTNDTGKKYANSIDALIGLIKNSDLKSAKDKKKVYDLLISNRENKDDKSAKFGFDARRVLFGQFFNKVGLAGKKPGGRLRDILDKDGFNHKGFYGIYGDENVMNSLDGRTEGMRLADGGFTMTGFFVDPTMSENDFVSKSKAGTYQHKQFNGRFFGENPFVLDGKYYVNEAFPEARFIDKKGRPVPVSTSAGGSMYPRTKTSPETTLKRAKDVAGVDFQRMAPNGKPSNLTAKQYEQVRTPAFKKWFGDWENDPANASKVVDENGEPLVLYHGSKNIFETFKPKYEDAMVFLTVNPEFASKWMKGVGGIRTRTTGESSYEAFREDARAYIEKNPMPEAGPEYDAWMANYPGRFSQDADTNIYPVFTNAKMFDPLNNAEFEKIFPELVKKYGSVDEANKMIAIGGNRANWFHYENKSVKDALKDFGYTGIWLSESSDVNAKTETAAIFGGPNTIKSATANVGTFSTEDARIQFQKGPLILRHGGETKIKNFDESKIKGGARGELGYGFYFSEDTKYKDYGPETTSIDASSLNLINEYSKPPSDLVERLLEWNKSLPESSFGIGKKEISENYIDTIQKVIKERPSYSISDVMKTVNSKYPASRERLWSEMMAGIGIDGMAATQGDGRGNVSIRQAVLYPQDKLNSLIIEEPQFQKATPTKDTRKGLRFFEKEKVVTIGGKKIVRLYKEEIISPKAKALFNNLFTSSGVLGEKIRTFKERMGGELNAEMDIAKRLTNESMGLIKKYKGVVSSQDIDDYLTGNTQTNQLPVELSSKLNEMRVHIDRLTDRLISLGVITSEESRQLYEANKGKYMLRSYELFTKGGDSPITIDNVTKRLDNVDQSKVDAALSKLETEIKKAYPNLTQDEVKKRAISDANLALSFDDMQFGGRGVDGSVNTQALVKRSEYLEDMPEVRALMGEYTDPIYKYYSSIFKLANITSHRAYLNSLKAEGMGKFLFQSPTGDAVTPVAGKNSDALAPLNGLFTFPEIYDALQKAERDKKSAIEFVAGHMRTFKTVYNPPTHLKNVAGNAIFLIQNGHWNGIDKTFEYIKSSNRAKLIDLLDILNREGVLNNNIGLKEIESYFDKHADIQSLLSTMRNQAQDETLVGRAKKYGKKQIARLNIVPNSFKKLYEFEDNMFKVLAFVSEANLYSNALYSKNYDQLSGAEIDVVKEKAAENVKRFYPTYSRVSKFVKVLSKTFLIGDFLSFPVEVIRASYNTLEAGVRESRDKNPKIRAIGRNRIAGTMLAHIISSGLAQYLLFSNGDEEKTDDGAGGLWGYMFDSDKQKERRVAAAEYKRSWNKYSEVINHKSSDGMLVYSDVGSMNPHSFSYAAWNAFWSNLSDEKGYAKAMSESVAAGFSGFMEFNMTAKMFLNIYNNEDEFGQKIYNPELAKGIQQKSPYIAKYVGKQMLPGMVNSMFKAYRYNQEGDDQKVINEATSQIVRTYTIDIKKEFTSFVYSEPYKDGTKGVGFKERLNTAKEIYTSIKNSKSASTAEKDEAYKAAIKAYKEVLSDVRLKYNSAIKYGVKARELNAILYKANLGNKRADVEAASIIDGNFNKPDNLFIRR